LYPEGEHPGKSGAADGQIVQNVHNRKKRLYCTVHYQEYLRGQDNNAAESLASICNNSANNEPREFLLLEMLVGIMPSIIITVMLLW
jgi:hypothetical protein